MSKQTKHIFKNKKRRNFTSLDNTMLDKADYELSWGALGILCHLLSKPPHWVVNNNYLYNKSTAGKRTVDRYLKELRRAGYLHRYKANGEGGKLQWVTEVYEFPEDNPHYQTNKSEPSTDGAKMNRRQATDGAKTDGRFLHHIVNNESSKAVQTKNPLKGSISDKESSSSARMRARDDDDDFTGVSNSSLSLPVTESYVAWKGASPTPAVANRLAKLVETYSADAVIAAIDVAVEHDGKSLKYVAAILKNGNSRKEQPNDVSEAELAWARELNERRRRAVELSRLRKDGETAGSAAHGSRGVPAA